MRYLLKISGEALQGKKESGFDHEYIRELCQKIGSLVDAGHQVAVLNGGGNIVRGEEFTHFGISGNAGHGMGLLGLVINSLMIQDVLIGLRYDAVVYTARRIEGAGDVFDARKAMRDLVGGCVVILGGGTGVPFFTTDTASATRSVELACDMMVKCTNVDAVYDKDPKQYPDATKYEKVSYDEVLTKNLRVMDQTSVAFARDHSLPVAVCHIDSIGQLISFDPDSFSGTLMK